MSDTKAFTLLEMAVDPAVHQVPNYLRMLQAYRSYVEEGASAQICAISLKEITCPGMRGQNLPGAPVKLTPQQEQLLVVPTSRLNQSVEEMLQSLDRGDRAGLAMHFQEAASCFQELSKLRLS
ncbi:hypothetical protein JST97_34120 [bacterium]|nr:hypothetical protein [bacterium]